MFREVIIREMERRGWSSYRLGQESGIPIRTVQRYTSGGCDLLGERVARLCTTLGLELRPVRKVRNRRKGKR
jgi:hypothetical protein